ncbi:acetyltransferase [Peptococcaceae bacterium]|nr:acetyltransferase [Peptococcaceae bacterium]
MNGLLIVGAGGHGRVVLDTALEIGKWEKIAFLDDYKTDSNIYGCAVIGKLNQAKEFLNEYSDVVVAFGDNFMRVQLLKCFMELGFNLPVVKHPQAFISKNAEVESGTVIFAQAVVNVGAKVGFGCIINSASVVEHDCILGDGVHLSPGVRLGGEVRIGKYSWIGIGASVIHRIAIGESVIIGGGAAVISDVEDYVTAVGVPARVVKKRGKSDKIMYSDVD